MIVCGNVGDEVMFSNVEDVVGHKDFARFKMPLAYASSQISL